MSCVFEEMNGKIGKLSSGAAKFKIHVHREGLAGKDFTSSGYVLVPGKGRGDSFVSFSVVHFEILCVPLVGSGKVSLEWRPLPPNLRVARIPSEMILVHLFKCYNHWARVI